jgi:Na+-transporting NADH:ubiquinone oxidoreductase subunit NqrA
VFDNVSLGGKIAKFLRNSAVLSEEKTNGNMTDISEIEKRFLKEVNVSKKTYKEIKKLVLAEGPQDRSKSGIIVESLINSFSKNTYIEKDKCEKLYDFINKLKD